MKKTVHTIFTYGTLMHKQRNHSLLDHAEYLGIYCLRSYALYDFGAYPGILPSAENNVLGECYQVDSAELARLDILEEEGTLYRRTPVTVFNKADGTPLDAETYVYLQDVFSCLLIKESDLPWTPRIQIQTMHIEDYAAAYTLWTSTPGMGLNALDDSEAGIASYLKRNPSTCFTARKDHKLVGVILAGHDGRRGFIYHMAVAAGCQRQGIGSGLLHSALEALKDEGIQKTALVVFSENEKGNAFWEKHGFTCRSDLAYRNRAMASLNQPKSVESQHG